MYYTITLLDSDACEVAVNKDVEGAKAAKDQARQMLNDSEYADAGAVRARVTNDNDEIVFDTSRSVQKHRRPQAV